MRQRTRAEVLYLIHKLTAVHTLTHAHTHEQQTEPLHSDENGRIREWRYTHTTTLSTVMRNDFRNDFCHVCDEIQYDSRTLLLCVRASERFWAITLSIYIEMLPRDAAQYFIRTALCTFTMGALCLLAFWMLSIINLSRSHLCVLFASNYFNVWRVLCICLLHRIHSFILYIYCAQKHTLWIFFFHSNLHFNQFSVRCSNPLLILHLFQCMFACLLVCLFIRLSVSLDCCCCKCSLHCSTRFDLV